MGCEGEATSCLPEPLLWPLPQFLLPGTHWSPAPHAPRPGCVLPRGRQELHWHQNRFDLGPLQDVTRIVYCLGK